MKRHWRKFLGGKGGGRTGHPRIGKTKDNLVLVVFFKTGEQVLGGGCRNPALLSSQRDAKEGGTSPERQYEMKKEMFREEGVFEGKERTRSSKSGSGRRRQPEVKSTVRGKY